VLGRTGRNFAAGMSGGIAWVHDIDGRFASRANTELVALEPLDGEDRDEVRELLERHRELTGSERAAALLGDWDAAAGTFVRVIPHDYRRVLEAQARMMAAGLGPDEAAMAAFEENAADLARVGGS
jgi:glutamate synthase (ferredoxin)